MSATVDVNVLVYASNEADPAHDPARRLVERLAAGPALVYLFWPTLLGYVRIVTHPAILPRPLWPATALANVASLLSLAHVRAPGEADGFLAAYQATADDQTRGNAVPDAHLGRVDATTRRYDDLHARPRLPPVRRHPHSGPVSLTRAAHAGHALRGDDRRDGRGQPRGPEDRVRSSARRSRCSIGSR